MLPRTLILVLAAVSTGLLATPVAAQGSGGAFAPGSYQLRLPGAGSVVAEVADGGELATLVIPAAVEITLTAGGELVIDDLLTPVPPDPPVDVATAPAATATDDEVAPAETELDDPAGDRRGRGSGQGEDDDEEDDDGEGRGNGARG
ncbi:MAG: hypothetical protein KY469_18270 [Actinobacteria bacterium]|nr:hypothetical protein [Actinomycetota bacterium]